MAGEKLRHHFGDYLVQAEVLVYSVLAILLFLTALATFLDSAKILWEGLRHWTIAAQTLQAQMAGLVNLAEGVGPKRSLSPVAAANWREALLDGLLTGQRHGLSEAIRIFSGQAETLPRVTTPSEPLSFYGPLRWGGQPIPPGFHTQVNTRPIPQTHLTKFR